MRLTATQRLEITGQVLSLCEDRGATHVDVLAAEIGCEPGDITAALEPLADLELVQAGMPLLDITHDVTVSDDGMVEVHFNWLRDLAGLSPVDAARLYVQIATARTFDPQVAVDLGSLRRRLEAIAGTIAFRDEIPDIVRDVMRPAQRLTVALVTLTAATTLPVGPVPVEIHKVWRDRDRWTTLVRFRRPVAGMVEAGELRTIDVYSIVSVELTAERFEPLLDDPGTAWLPFHTPVRAVIEHDHSADWLFDRIDVESRTPIGDGQVRSEITIGGVGPLGVLLLRLGRNGRLVEPQELAGIQSDLAKRMLAVYGA
jgi:hypothetical protein